MDQAPLPPINPWAGHIGWCHACETIQTGDEARWQEISADYVEPFFDWVCVTCDAETWGMGVWPDRVGYHDEPWTTWTPAARAWARSHPLPE